MPSDNAKLAAGMSTAAAIAAVIAMLRSGKAEAAPGEIPEELWNLIIAIAASADAIDKDLDEVIEALSKGAGQGWPPNTNAITAIRVPLGAANVGVQMPFMLVPDGMTLFIKAWALNPGWLQVGGSRAESQNINSSFPLLPSETVWYHVQNADSVWVSPTVAGCFVVLTVEHRK